MQYLWSNSKTILFVLLLSNVEHSSSVTDYPGFQYSCLSQRASNRSTSNAHGSSSTRSSDDGVSPRPSDLHRHLWLTVHVFQSLLSEYEQQQQQRRSCLDRFDPLFPTLHQLWRKCSLSDPQWMSFLVFRSTFTYFYSFHLGFVVKSNASSACGKSHRPIQNALFPMSSRQQVRLSNRFDMEEKRRWK